MLDLSQPVCKAFFEPIPVFMKIDINWEIDRFGHRLSLPGALVLLLSFHVEIHDYCFRKIISHAVVVFIINDNIRSWELNPSDGGLYFLLGSVEICGYNAGNVLSVLFYLNI